MCVCHMFNKVLTYLLTYVGILHVLLCDQQKQSSLQHDTLSHAELKSVNICVISAFYKETRYVLSMYHIYHIVSGCSITNWNVLHINSCHNHYFIIQPVDHYYSACV